MATVNTDFFSPAWSPGGIRASRIGISQMPADIPDCIQAFNDILVSVNWISAGLYATGSLTMTDFFGDEYEPLIMDGFHYRMPGGFITLAALAVSIGLNSPYNATAGFDVHGIQTIFLTAKLPGPLYNQPTVKILGSINPDTGGGYEPKIAFGGGYKLTSVANPTTGDQIVVSIYEDNNGQISFNFGVPTYTLASGLDTAPDFAYLQIPKYTIIANPFQFLIVDEVNSDDHPNGFVGGNSLFATTPYIDPTKSPALFSCIIIVGPGVIKTSLVWQNHPVSIAINGPFQTFNPGTGVNDQLGLVSRNFPFATPLVAFNDKPLIQNAYLMAPAAYREESFVVGKIWDGVVFSQSGSSYPIGLEVTNNGKILHNVSNQDAAVNSSFWLASQFG